MIGEFSWRVCQIVVLSLDYIDELLLDITLYSHPLKLEYQFYLDIIISISSFADEIFGQTFDDIGINGYRMRIYIGDKYVIVGIIDPGDDIPLGSTSVLAGEFKDLSLNLIEFLESNKIERRKDVTFQLREEISDQSIWANLQGQITIIDTSV